MIGRSMLAATVVAIAAFPTQSVAWGYEGHRVVATIAQSFLTPKTRAKIDGLLAADNDTSTGPDFASRATWADVYRASHRETSEWHFVNLEIDQPDVRSACFGFPASAQPVSSGPAEDCVVGRVRAFLKELADPATPELERILALKFVLHFMGDLHQPLHASDNHDKGGNCVRLALGGARTTNLHSYWDTVVVDEMNPDADALAVQLRAQITAADAASWRKGDVLDWTEEAYAIAKSIAYWPGETAGCARDAAPQSPPPGYDAAVRKAVALQLERAGVRLATVLNQAFDPNPIPAVRSSR